MIVEQLAFALSERLSRLIKRIRITYRDGGFKIELKEEKEEKIIDERIGKIDEADMIKDKRVKKNIEAMKFELSKGQE